MPVSTKSEPCRCRSRSCAGRPPLPPRHHIPMGCCRRGSAGCGWPPGVCQWWASAASGAKCVTCFSGRNSLSRTGWHQWRSPNNRRRANPRTPAARSRTRDPGLAGSAAHFRRLGLSLRQHIYGGGRGRVPAHRVPGGVGPRATGVALPRQAEGAVPDAARLLRRRPRRAHWCVDPQCTLAGPRPESMALVCEGLACLL